MTTADDISTRNDLDWVQREAEKTQIPLGINLGVPLLTGGR